MVTTALRIAATACALVVAAGCGSDDDGPAPEPDAGLIDATTMRGALLQAADVGPTWAPPAQAPDPAQLVRFCPGPTDATPLPVPPGAEHVEQTVVDEGPKGAQTLNQSALVYPDVTGARAGLAALQAVADGCDDSVTVPLRATGNTAEPAFTETAATSPLTEGRWTGFVLERHKTYEPTHPGTAHTAVVVLARSNVVLVNQYAIYRLGATPDTAATRQFQSDWRRLVGTVLTRVG